MVPPGVVGPRRPACARSQRRSQRRSRRPEDGRTDVGATSAADRSAVGRPPPPPLPPPLPPPRSRPAGPPTSSSPAGSPTGDQEQLLDQLHPFPSQLFFRPTLLAVSTVVKRTVMMQRPSLTDVDEPSGPTPGMTALHHRDLAARGEARWPVSA